MRISLTTLRRFGNGRRGHDAQSPSIERLIIESVDLSLYIAHAVINGQRRLITDADARPLKTSNLMAMKALLRDIDAPERVLQQRSAYDEMVGREQDSSDNCLEIPLGEGYESLPVWRH